ncbi:bifunctional acetaldehyde-CoA/alcohol dehydrogenase [Demequina lignilytica]|uniref:Aldehyde-alcohol dehydrogenase n=1 Tax=Demequina lignilytica TaxID=3051663 RepID=A0AAW7M599_9MICO|nr:MULTISPECIES: bifunctional acetaldehyde-CoA/alcohol dehydrogenase [unclassified Demequina]MDN4478910.1 bifunctional acetaldehyde-CoA/alcohol dehydrogenase [Demequina sp. SYSU T00039-1]MDN4483043.1 bifunctional acetaldehyde-CoA/alcohol dehydrogenase [Demequina sp. SYSU T0a273]MDN4488785.1 bifunctional acetaldehyde-CoA/alcohol dehydrogenase [Demequina sp. SYSU T00039]MDN4491831.1 bifunctional acetaldehyde-CoA/alcohol dehydrogenase [Demequina sp. SYSU T00068]
MTTTAPESKATVSVADAIDQLVQNGKKALDAYSAFTQDDVNLLVKKASVAALNQHGELAVLAVEETGRGVFEDKAVKNIFACEHVTHSMAPMKTVGIINEDPIKGIIEIAEPVGVVAGVTPVTNPTSTAIFKSLIALKTRNPIIFAFHPSAQKSSIAAAKIVRDAAIAAGAPEHCIQWVETPSIEATNALMNHDGVALILATGGNAMVKAAYSCGKPALGVGAGNVPAYVHKSANLKRSINDLVISKAFDNGMVCASEQAVILDAEIYDEALSLFDRLHAYMATPAEKAMLEEFIFGVQANGENCAGAKLNPNVVGKTPQWIAEQAGFSVPEETSIILAEVSTVGESEPLTREKLAPVLAVLKAESTEQGLEYAQRMVEFHGLGHSAAIHATDDELVKEFGKRCKAVRIIVNSPSSHGGIGDIYNAFMPSLTLGCGSYGRNSVSANVTAVNLINVKRIGRRNNNMQWFKVPAKTYFEPNAIQYLHDMNGVERVTIVTDATMTRIGVVDKVLDVLNRRTNPVSVQIMDNVEPEPSVSTVRKGAETLRAFKPDTIIAVGGGSPMDAAKVMWLLYEHPEVDFADLKEKFFDVRKRAFQFPKLGELAKLVCIPTTSGTGSEVTPFAVISDPENGRKYPLADYALTPTVAIVDPVLTANLPSRVAADSGFDALTHATEAYVSVYANDYTDGLALQAIKMVFQYIEESVTVGGGAVKAREKMHNAATIAGMAFANAFLGLVHAMSHVTGSTHHVAHGRTNAIYLPHVIRYNGKVPTKPTSWPKAESYVAPERYQEIAQMLGLPASTPEEGVESYAKAVEELRDKVGIERSFQEVGVDETDFMSGLDTLAMNAYADQCAPANPRLPILEDMKVMMEAAYYGTTWDQVKAGRKTEASPKVEAKKAPAKKAAAKKA